MHRRMGLPPQAAGLDAREPARPPFEVGLAAEKVRCNEVGEPER